MDQDSKSDYVPRAPRFKVEESSKAIVRITRTSLADQEPMQAALLDISQHGMKIRVPVNLQFEEALQLEIEVRGTDMSYQGVASVRHIRAVDEENWVVGCAIAPAISDEAFSYLATTSGKERRQFRRLPIAAQATVRRQAQAEGCEVGLHNLSSGGFCFTSPVQYEIGERVQLLIEGQNDENRVIEARIRWQVDSPDGSIVGCQFSTRSSYADLCACLTELPLKENAQQKTEERTSQLVLVAAVLAMFVPPLLTVLLQSDNVSAETSPSAPVEIAIANPPEECLQSEPSSTEPSSIETDEQLADEDLLAALKAEVFGEDQFEQSAPEPPKYREWVDNTGKHRTEALLLKVTSEDVLLEKPDGRRSNVPLRRLSVADREYAAIWADRE